MIDVDKKVQEIRDLKGLDADTAAELRGIEGDVLMNYTLADAIREGSEVTDQAYTWEKDGKVCALSAAVLAAKARHYIQ